MVFLLLFALGFVIQSCDKNETDCIYIDKRMCDPDYIAPDTTVVIPFDIDLTGYQEKVLLEEFTGFLCINCPTATSIAVSLKEQYPERLSIVAIHCTPFFAGPLTEDPDEPFHLDFRTDEGEELYEYFLPDGLPSGVINRRGTQSSNTITYQNWADRLNVLMADNNPEVYLKIGEPEVNQDSTVLKAQVIVKPLILDPGESYVINMGLMENGIEEAQKAPNNVTLYDYIHNHVFRGNSDGTWGRLAYEGDSELGEGEALLMTMSIDLNPEWKLENSELFVYVYRQSNREVIQVEEIKIGD